MTNGWVDMKNTDMMLIMGGNPAENHPCGFKWPIEAKRTRGAKMISVDPRFTRSPAARKSRIRSNAAKPQLRVPTAKETLLALYAGNGRAHHGDSERTIPEGRRPLHFDSQRRRHEEGRHDHLRCRMDATHV